ncbi:MAG: hypothetical protein MI739_00225 [Bacteroidales bacterium]|nr:hypothetical protein [Bacteroidales bacterium]
MKLKLSIALFCICNVVVAKDITTYLNKYKKTGISDYKIEQNIINKYSYEQLESKLNPFFSDTIKIARQKAYYFIYKKGTQIDSIGKKKATNKLLQGCFDKNGGIVGVLLSNLTDFDASDFDNKAKETIDRLLEKKKMFHKKELAMLAGITNTGHEIMKNLFSSEDETRDTKWGISLALARQGSVVHINYCFKQISDIPVNNAFISYIIPDLIYTRQRKLIDFCKDIIFRDTKDCFSPNPDEPEDILCAYRVMELIAPAIENFPYRLDATGSLNTDNYKKALKVTRKWFRDNPDYKIRL